MVHLSTLCLLASATLLCLGCSTTRANSDSATTPTACVILLHGLGRSAYSMNKIAHQLQTEGYAVWNQGYPSRSDTIETLAANALGDASTFCSQYPSVNIHVVTHSMGGILLRHYLQSHQLSGLDKIVMLSPPNHGSEIVDSYHNNWLFRWAMGPAFLQLGTKGLVSELEPIPGCIGVITGNKSSDPWFSGTIPGPDDGKVSVVSAQLEEMQDFLVVPVGHTSIMQDDQVIQHISHFLAHGKFSQASPQLD